MTAAHEAPVVALDGAFGGALPAGQRADGDLIAGRDGVGLSATTFADLANTTAIDNLVVDPVAALPINIVAVEDAWLRVRDGEAKTLFTGILGAGDRFILPPDAEAPVLRAGNAGAVYLVVGDAAFGPLGAGPVVAKNVQLTPDAIRAAYPVADDVAFEAVGGARRAAVAAQEAVAQLPTD